MQPSKHCIINQIARLGALNPALLSNKLQTIDKRVINSFVARQIKKTGKIFYSLMLRGGSLISFP